MIRLALKPPVSDRVVILDGISRSGKKLSCRILSHLRQIEHFQYLPLVENIANLFGLGLIEKRNAASLIQMHLDEAIYNRIIGRNLNMRAADESALHHSVEPDIYRGRMTGSDGISALADFRATGRASLFHTHSILAYADVIFDAIPYCKLVHVTRHPVDIAEDWLRRGWGKRWGNDPITFNLIVEGPNENEIAPWFAADWIESYVKMSEEERCVESVIRLQEADRTVLESLPAECKAHVFQYSFERLITKPMSVVADLCSFLSTSPHANLPILLEREKLPVSISPDTRRNNFRRLSRACSPEILIRLRAASQRYEDVWGLSAFPE